MSKVIYALALAASVMLFNSCYDRVAFRGDWGYGAAAGQAQEGAGRSRYGAYLAGRVAHLRKDFNTAADYYAKAAELAPGDADLTSRVYIILTMQERVGEAAEFARKAIAAGDGNNLARIVVAVEEAKQGRFESALAQTRELKSKAYREFIAPLLEAWIHAGAGDKAAALAAAGKLKAEPSLRAVYRLHRAMLLDYFGESAEAGKAYAELVKEEKGGLALRAVLLAANFLERQGHRDEALALLDRTSGGDQLFTEMLSKARANIAKGADSGGSGRAAKPPRPLIDSADKGLSEALFNIASSLRLAESGADAAHLFICLAVYADPHYDLAKLMLADILEKREAFEQANKLYGEIELSPDSEAYFPAMVKHAGNLAVLKDYAAAEKVLRKLAKRHRDMGQLYFDLGDVLRLQGQYKAAAKNYKLAIDKVPAGEEPGWIVFYTLGIAYDQAGQWRQAEESFKKALELSGNHFLPLNYLGYVWIRDGRNAGEAFSMIADAYAQAPDEGNVSDSMGYALYRIGRYDEAIGYLEKASDLEPSEAAVYDHLGDAYWQAGRKVEARYQWSHALKSVDGIGEFDAKATRRKLEKGLGKVEPLAVDEAVVEKAMFDLEP